jgi:hypothetical protein
MAANLPTYQLNATSVAARAAEVASADFAGGVNRGGSCAPGIGINTGATTVPSNQHWSLLDQAGAARAPQDSQHIGGDGLGAGDATTNPINVIIGADVNDTAAFVTADTQAADGAEFDSVSGAVNRTGATIEVGETAWGTIPVL